MIHIRLTSGEVRRVDVELEHAVRGCNAALNCRVLWQVGGLTLNPLSVEEILTAGRVRAHPLGRETSSLPPVDDL